MIKEYISIEHFFLLLQEKNISYVVMRSYEKLLNNKNYLYEGHDIDILCSEDDFERLLSIIGCVGLGEGPLYILVEGYAVQIDVISTINEEYPHDLCRETLRRRELYKDICYVPCKENEIKLLMYHCIKLGYIPDKYKLYLKTNFEDMKLQISSDNLDDIKSHLSFGGETSVRQSNLLVKLKNYFYAKMNRTKRTRRSKGFQLEAELQLEQQHLRAKTVLRRTENVDASKISYENMKEFIPVDNVILYLHDTGKLDDDDINRILDIYIAIMYKKIKNREVLEYLLASYIVGLKNETN